MCTGFTIDGIYMNTMCAVSLAYHLRAVVDMFHPLRLISATEQPRGELHKSEILVIASTLLVGKTKNIYQSTIKMHKLMEIELSH